MSRGKLTEAVKWKSKELLGYEISQNELRLLPYISYIMQNEQKIDYKKINEEEIEILQKWSDNKYIIMSDSKITITKRF